MIDPKQKAKELVDKFYNLKWKAYKGRSINQVSMTKEASIECAKIAASEMLEYLTTSTDILTSTHAVNYWKEVLNELNKM